MTNLSFVIARARREQGNPDGAVSDLVRISVGIEHINDIKAELVRALEA